MIVLTIPAVVVSALQHRMREINSSKADIAQKNAELAQLHNEMINALILLEQINEVWKPTKKRKPH